MDNPLLHLESEELKIDVEAFHNRHTLSEVVDLQLLTRGSLLARDEESFLDSDDYTDVEKRALENEKTSRLIDQSKELKIVLLVCVVAAITKCVNYP